MPRDEKPGVRDNKNLVKRILDNPQLPAYVAQLGTPALNRLIQYVGKEDAQELIVHATPEQLQELVEFDAFQGDAPGQEESFDPDRFLEWLALFEEMDPKTLAERVSAIGADMLALALDHHVVVIDTTTVGITDENFEYVAIETFSNFGVLPKDEETWPPVRQLLTIVWDEDADLVESTLALCCQRRSVFSERTHVTGNDTLDTDVKADREARRQRQGFVTPLTASVFLGDARGTSIDELLIAVAYDPTTAMQLRQVRAQKAQVNREADGDVSPRDARQSESTPGKPGFAEIDALLAEADILPRPASMKLLEGPKRDDEMLVQRLLRELGPRNPEALAARLDEIVFLANILVAGTSVQGMTFTEAEAAKCVYATCNLGIDYCLNEDPFDDGDVMLASFLEQDPGLVKAFKIGYHLIGQLPFKAIMAMVRELTTTRGQRRLRSDPWLQDQVARDLSLEDLANEVTNDHLFKVKEVLDLMMTLFDTSTCSYLKMLCDPMPCFPKALDQSKPQLTVNRRTRYIHSSRDLQRLLRYLDTIELL